MKEKYHANSNQKQNLLTEMKEEIDNSKKLIDEFCISLSKDEGNT